MSYDPIFSLAMIVGVYDDNTLEKLGKCLDNIKDHVDEIVIALDTRTMDGTREVCEERGAKCYDYEWDETIYEGARRFSFSKATGIAVMWLDGDDVVSDPAKLRKYAYDYIINDDRDVIVLPYDYSHDENGNCSCRLMRERVIRAGTQEWRGGGGIHERLVPHGVIHQEIVEDVVVIHNEADRPEQTNARHRRVMEPIYAKMKKDGHESLDERDWYYLSVSSAGCSQFETADMAFKIYWEKYGNNMDSVYIYSLKTVWGDMCFIRGMSDHAFSHWYWCIVHFPNTAQAYTKIAALYSDQKSWVLAKMFAEQAAITARADDGLITGFDPRLYDLLPCKVLARAYFFLMDLEKSKDMVQQGLKNCPKDKSFQSLHEKIVEIEDNAATVTSFAEVMYKIGDVGGRELFKKVPMKLQEAPVFASYSYDPVEDFNRDVVYINRNLEPLSPFMRSKGCGGSEESLILEAEEMASRGYKTTVYAESLLDGVQNHNGVRYLPLTHFDPTKSYGILVSYRGLPEFDCGVQAKFKVHALQDVFKTFVISGKRENTFDLLRASTEWHREPADFLGDKAKVIPFGILPEEYESKGLLRDPYRCVWTSRAERGLVDLMEIWPDIKKAHPRAQLTICAYVDEVGQMMAKGTWSSSMSWYQKALKRISEMYIEYRENGLGVNYFYHSRQPHLMNLLPNCGTWLYPSEFEETFCFSALKAQAAGVYPVAICRGALKETIHPDYQFSKEEWLEKACYYIGRDVKSEREELHNFAVKFSVKNSVDKFEEALEAIRASRREPKTLEPVGA